MVYNCFLLVFSQLASHYFFKHQIFHFLYVVFIRSPAEEYLVCFQVVAVMKGAVNNVCRFLWGWGINFQLLWVNKDLLVES